MKKDQVQICSDPQSFPEKEALYLELRRIEGRVLEDNVVINLPNISASSPYAKEWRWRKRSFLLLHKYLVAHKKGSIRILDLGCGNGWMSNQLAKNPKWNVTATDLNLEELEQGARLFGRDNLTFAYADVVSQKGVFSDDFQKIFGEPFDIILLAASVQYFRDLEALVISLRKRLKTGGEIHFIDSHFYSSQWTRNEATWRSHDYFLKMGVPKMLTYYHHHHWPEMKKLGGENLHNNFTSKLLQKIGWLAPFPWIRMRN